MKEIKLSQRNKNKSDLVALVDDEDYEYLNMFKWHVRKSGNHYSARRWVSQGNATPMHREIMKLSPKDKRVVDHIDHNPLNNQRYNLRVCTIRENLLNRTGFGASKYLGVFWQPIIKRWTAQIKINGASRHIGCFLNEEEAARRYDIKATELYGEFANLNFKP